MIAFEIWDANDLRFLYDFMKKHVENDYSLKCLLVFKGIYDCQSLSTTIMANVHFTKAEVEPDTALLQCGKRLWLRIIEVDKLDKVSESTFDILFVYCKDMKREMVNRLTGKK